MSKEKEEKEVKKIRVSTLLSPNEKRYLERLAAVNLRSASSQLRSILLDTVEVDDDDEDEDN